MPKKTPPKELLRAITESSIEALRDIDCLHVCKYADDASGAIRSGAVLLAIAQDSEKDSEGFRYLIGLNRTTKITPYLSNYFER
jgi:hypothetical protein